MSGCRDILWKWPESFDALMATDHFMHNAYFALQAFDSSKWICTLGRLVGGNYAYLRIVQQRVKRMHARPAGFAEAAVGTVEAEPEPAEPKETILKTDDLI